MIAETMIRVILLVAAACALFGTPILAIVRTMQWVGQYCRGFDDKCDEALRSVPLPEDQVIADRKVRRGKRRSLTASILWFSVAALALLFLANAPEYGMFFGLITAVAALAGISFAWKNHRLQHSFVR